MRLSVRFKQSAWCAWNLLSCSGIRAGPRSTVFVTDSLTIMAALCSDWPGVKVGRVWTSVQLSVFILHTSSVTFCACNRSRHHGSFRGEAVLWIRRLQASVVTPNRPGHFRHGRGQPNTNPALTLLSHRLFKTPADICVFVVVLLSRVSSYRIPSSECEQAV